MAQGHVQPGATMPHTNTTGVVIAAGTVIGFADMVGIALGYIAPGAVGELAICEVWDLPKEAALDIAQGDQVYWDAANNRVDKTNTNIPCGKAFATAASAAATVLVKLNA